MNKTWFLIAAALGVFATQGMIQVVPPLLVEIASDIQISVAVAGQLVTVTFAAWAVSVVLVGPLSDTFGRRPVAIFGLLSLSISVLASAFAPNLEVLMALRVLTGLGGGTIPPNTVGAIADVISPERRAQAVSAMLAIGMFSSVTIVPIVALLADWGGWRLSLLASGVLPAVGLLANWFWFPKDGRERVRHFSFLPRYRSLVSLRFFRVALAVSTAQRIAFWGMTSYFAAYLIDAHGVNVGFVALPLAITAIGPVVGSYCAAFVATRGNRAMLIAATSVAGGICGLLLFTFDLGLWASVAVATLGTGLLGVTFPALVYASTEYSGQSRATGVGLMGMSNQAGGMIGAGVAGAVLASTGYHGIGYFLLGVTIISALMTPLFGREFAGTSDKTQASADASTAETTPTTRVP